jgi:hypothetical protein
MKLASVYTKSYNVPDGPTRKPADPTRRTFEGRCSQLATTPLLGKPSSVEEQHRYGEPQAQDCTTARATAKQQQQQQVQQQNYHRCRFQPQMLGMLPMEWLWIIPRVPGH